MPLKGSRSKIIDHYLEALQNTVLRVMFTSSMECHRGGLGLSVSHSALLPTFPCKGNGGRAGQTVTEVSSDSLLYSASPPLCV